MSYHYLGLVRAPVVSRPALAPLAPVVRSAPAPMRVLPPAPTRVVRPARSLTPTFVAPTQFRPTLVRTTKPPAPVPSPPTMMFAPAPDSGGGSGGDILSAAAKRLTRTTPNMIAREVTPEEKKSGMTKLAVLGAVVIAGWFLFLRK